MLLRTGRKAAAPGKLGAAAAEAGAACAAVALLTKPQAPRSALGIAAPKKLRSGFRILRSKAWV